MKRVIGSIVATVASLALLLGFKTHTPEVAANASNTAATSPLDESTTSSSDTTNSTTSPSSSSPSSTNSTASTTTAKSTTTTAKSTSSGTKTITGSAADTRYGPVQVSITVNGTKITAVNVIDYPQDNPRDVSINQRAVPQLVSQALSAQSANINGVSGATYTSVGFAQSLQSAINKI